MDVLESYGNKKIVADCEGVVKYLIESRQLTDKEEALLNNCEKLFTQSELETVRKEPDIALRRDVLHEYLKIKIPDSKNRETLIESMINKVIGYGRLDELISDPNLEEVMVNGVNLPVYVFHKKYGMCPTNLIFDNKEEIFKIINRLCWIHEKELMPIVDMTAIDGSRINITSEPLSLHGPSITIRKQKKHFLTISELIANKTLDVETAALLWLSVDGLGMNPANLIIAGMIGSGKTTLLNALAMLSPPQDRIITIEETSELQIAGKKNWVPLVCDKNYDAETLVRNTLRMRPNKIIVGEIRGHEAMALFNAMNVGHKGMGTMHANSSREVIFRLESPPMNVPTRVIANLDIIVIMNILNYDGVPVRRVTEVAEVGGHEGNTILLGEVFRWDPKKDGAEKSDVLTPSAYLDKLSAKIKIDKRQIVKELAKRKEFLQNLVDNSILSYEAVLSEVRKAYSIWAEETLGGNCKDKKT